MERVSKFEHTLKNPSTAEANDLLRMRRHAKFCGSCSWRQTSETRLHFRDGIINHMTWRVSPITRNDEQSDTSKISKL
jgi:hypothetical protein